MGNDLRDNLMIKACCEHPYVATVSACLAALIVTGGQFGNTPALWITGAVLFVLIFAFAVFLKVQKKLTFEASVVLIFMAGFALRLFYVLYTDLATRQNDVGTFEEGVYNYFHSGYILYVRDNMSLPSIDVRQAGQFYHPPLHYIICAAFLKVYELFLRGGHNYEALQILTLCYAQISSIVAYKILKLLGLKEDVLLPSSAILSFFPEFILLSGSINNDSLCTMLTFFSFYIALMWYRDGKLRNAIISAVFAGLAMMTKLSAGLIAVPLAVLFIARFIKKDKVRTIGHAAAYGGIAIPLGLWFQVRNLLMFGVPLGYVLRSDNIYQDISRFPVSQRLFGLYPVPIEDFFMNLGSDGQQDYNTTIALIKTALFGEWNYRDSMAQSLPGYFLLWIFTALVIASLAGGIYMVVTIRKRGLFAEEMSLAALFVAELISYTAFALKYPHICSMNFRYTVPLLICGTYFTARLVSGRGRAVLALKVLSAAFAVLTALFYILLATYVMGEVEVVDVTW